MLKVTGAHAGATVNGPLTSGMVGLPVTIECDEAWEGLTKNLVCRCSSWDDEDVEIRTILNVGNAAVVAHEVMQAGKHLYLGLEGFTPDGELVIPTTWAMCGVIEKGANTGEDISADPTLPVWNQLQTQIEQLKSSSIPQELLDEIQASVETAVEAASSAERSKKNASSASVLAVNSAESAEVSADSARTSMEDARNSVSSAAYLANETLRLQRAAEAAAERAEEAANGQNLDLGFVDGRLYILVSGVPVGNGVEIGGAVVPPEQPESSEGVVVFAADFSGDRPDPAQFYTWEGRVYNGATWDALENIRCVDGVAVLTNKYDADRGLWVEQLMTTGGLFESDDFTCKFRAKFSGLPGSWNYFITYGTGTHWTDGMYSDGIRWPAGGEIDSFEQAPTYSANPTAIMHGAHWGSGSNSGYPDTHEWIPDGAAGKTVIDTDEWHDFKFQLKNGVATMWIDGAQVHMFDLSGETVSNNYLADYHPFLRPHALYMAAQCHSADSQTDKTNVYVMEISDLKVYQDALVECTALEIYPQMWDKGTELIFPVGAELYLDRKYTPSNTSNKACRWESSDNSVATVVQGYVKVVGTGTAVITATCGNAAAQYTVTAAEAANVPCVKLVTKGEVGTVVGDTVDVAEWLYLYPGFTTDEIVLSSESGLVSINGSSVTMLGSGAAEVAVTVGGCNATLMLNIASGAPELMMEHDYVVNGVVNGNPQSYIQWVAGGTYTLHYQVTENPKYTGTVEFPMSCRMMNDKGSNRAPEVRFVTSGDCEIYVGDAYACHTYTPAPGDWVTIVFTAAGGKTAAVYINGQLVADDFQVYESYLYIGESLRPVEVFERTAVPKYCVGSIEIYRGDDRERHRAG